LPDVSLPFLPVTVVVPESTKKRAFDVVGNQYQAQIYAKKALSISPAAKDYWRKDRVVPIALASAGLLEEAQKCAMAT
jgi:hypothetical protein